MNIFQIRNNVIHDYNQYVESFLNIKNERIRQFVHNELAKGVLWPDPLIQLNPTYEMGKTVAELVEEGILHPQCGEIFQTPSRKSFHLYFHQEKAIITAQKKEPYVLTTGTGSGKSLTYIVPMLRLFSSCHMNTLSLLGLTKSSIN